MDFNNEIKHYKNSKQVKQDYQRFKQNWQFNADDRSGEHKSGLKLYAEEDGVVFTNLQDWYKKMQEEGLGLKDIETYRDDLQLQFELINHKNPYVEKKLTSEEELKELEEMNQSLKKFSKLGGVSEEKAQQQFLDRAKYFEELMNRR